MQNENRCYLDMLLSGGAYFECSYLAVRSLIVDLGEDAEIFSDALHALIRDGDFGCPEDGCKAILWAMMFDANGRNFMRPEFDVLRNGVARDYLLRQCPSAPEEVPGDE